MKRTWATALTTLLGIITALWICRMLIVDWSEAEIRLPEPITFEFPRATRLSTLASSLNNRGIVSSGAYFTIWVRFIKRNYPKFQAGTYRFQGSVSPAQVIGKLMKGDVYQPLTALITIPEGFTLEKIVNRLAANGISSKDELWKLLKSQKFLKKHKIHMSKSGEGFLYPATYRFTQKIPTAEEALSTMIEKFWKTLPENYEKEINQLGLTLHKAVIFASMIELETKFDDERHKIAEVIWRRLKSNQPLGIDAALIYGIEDYRGDIKWKHLKDRKNPYNLRIHRGLPPTPIGSPSLASLNAVLSPSQHGVNFYVLADDHSGRHFFSKTNSEHNKAVQRYLRSIKKGKR
jgi:UPF0755 protein